MQRFNKEKYRFEMFFHQRFDVDQKAHLPKGLRAYTFAVVVAMDGRYGIGVAKCTKRHQFNRRLLVNVARGRARKATLTPLGIYQTTNKKELYQYAYDLFTTYKMAFLVEAMKTA